MNDDVLQHRLLELFARHGVELEADEDWLLTDGDFPAIRAHWQAGAGEAPGRLDIDVVLDEQRHVAQSFAGEAQGEAGCRQALERFTRSDLPVLLAACWYVTDDRALDLAQWQIGLRGWDAFIGRFVVEGADIEVPAGLLPAVAHAIQNEALTPQLHWVRLLLRRAADGTQAVEALLDNAPWPAGDRALDSVAWPASAQSYSVRSLLMLDVRDY